MKPITHEQLEKNIELPQMVKKQARMQELRMREKKPLVTSGQWIHWLHTALPDLVAKLRASVEELVELACAATDGKMSAAQLAEFWKSLRVLRQAADIANWALFIAERVMSGARLEKIEKSAAGGAAAKATGAAAAGDE